MMMILFLYKIFRDTGDCSRNYRAMGWFGWKMNMSIANSVSKACHTVELWSYQPEALL